MVIRTVHALILTLFLFPALHVARAGAPDGNRYVHLIQSAAQTHGVDPALIQSVIEVESAFDHRAVSHAGARGLMQLMPATATRYGVRNVNDPMENIGGGTRYLKELPVRYDGDLKRSLVAYNAGEDAVAKYDGIPPPYRETKQYIKKVLKRYRQNPERSQPLMADMETPGSTESLRSFEFRLNERTRWNDWRVSALLFTVIMANVLVIGRPDCQPLPAPYLTVLFLIIRLKRKCPKERTI